MRRIFAERRKGFIAMLATLCLAAIITGFVRTGEVEALSTQVSMAAQKSMYETQELMAGIQLNLQKLLVSNSPEHRRELLQDIIRQSEAAADDLSAFSPDQQSIEGAIKFVNQTGDYAASLSRVISLGGDISGADSTQLNAMLATCVRLNAQIVESIRKMETGEIEVQFSDDMAATEVEPAVNYPVLLYDGPFSDAIGDENFVPAGNEVSASEAADSLRRFIGAERAGEITLTGESDIMSKCYEFEAELPFGSVSAAVTAMGGHILYMLPENDMFETNVSRDECIQNGLDFLKSRGFGETAVSYWRRQEGILTVNYVPVMDGVVVYPDLIKLQISLGDGQVAGAEVGNYLRNHIDRTFSSPVITADAATALVNPLLSVSNVRLCLIPLDKAEYLCWEIAGTFEGGDDYLVYIDAVSSRERTILQIVETGDGVLTQ